ncbi:MAG TPA: type II toxin-antitoxin system HicA family toxin [Chitinophagales bacterium]|nr:type II toxin-antitoxin system HicA family toxin [Chitinophagales bacterium]
MRSNGNCDRRQLSGKQLCAIAEKLGWELKRIQGSRYIYAKQGSRTFPCTWQYTLKIGLLKALLKIMEESETDL